MKKKEIILIGGGGHCLSVIDTIESADVYKIAGIVDPGIQKGSTILGYEVLGDDSLLPELVREGFQFHITIGQIRNPGIRQSIYEKITIMNGSLVTVAASTSYISPHATIGSSCTIMHHSFVNAGARIGNNCIINTGALVEHEAEIGEHCHISTYAKVNGQVKVGKRVFIGSNATVFNNVKIGDDVLIGAGAVIAKDVRSGSKIIAAPPKFLK